MIFRLRACLGLFVSALTIVCGVAQAQDSTRDDLLNNLRRTMTALATARAAADGGAWSRYVTDEFVVVHPDGRIHDRTQEIAELNGSRPTAILVRRAERLQWHGDHTIVYVSDFASVTGQPLRAIEVWIHEGSEWKIRGRPGDAHSTVTVTRFALHNRPHAIVAE